MSILSGVETPACVSLSPLIFLATARSNGYSFNICFQDIFSSLVLLQSSFGLGHSIDLLFSRNSLVSTFLLGIYSNSEFLHLDVWDSDVFSYHRDPYLYIPFWV